MEQKKFEDAMKRLEEIVQMLENGDLTLEESLEIFEEGMNLIRFCTNKLEEAEKRVTILVQESEGEYIQVPFKDKEDEE